MTDDVVNLRMARKARARGQAEVLAAANRARFGESKAAKKAREAEAARAKRTLDGNRREPD
jgi:hypothetical protein